MPVFGVPTWSRTRSLIGPHLRGRAPGRSSRLERQGQHAFGLPGRRPGVVTGREVRPAREQRVQVTHDRVVTGSQAALDLPGLLLEPLVMGGGYDGPRAGHVREPWPEHRAEQLRTPRRGDQETQRAGRPPGQLGRVGGHVGQHARGGVRRRPWRPGWGRGPRGPGRPHRARPPTGPRWRPGRRGAGGGPRRRIAGAEARPVHAAVGEAAGRPVVGDHRGQVGADDGDDGAAATRRPALRDQLGPHRVGEPRVADQPVAGAPAPDLHRLGRRSARSRRRPRRRAPRRPGPGRPR